MIIYLLFTVFRIKTKKSKKLLQTSPINFQKYFMKNILKNVGGKAHCSMVLKLPIVFTLMKES